MKPEIICRILLASNVVVISGFAGLLSVWCFFGGWPRTEHDWWEILQFMVLLGFPCAIVASTIAIVLPRKRLPLALFIIGYVTFIATPYGAVVLSFIAQPLQ
jgi:hypothetical protein